jgi:hypothetical protein
MALPGHIEGALSFAPGFDSDTIVTAAVAQQFFSQGYKFCVRYLTLLGQQTAGDLSSKQGTFSTPDWR